MFSIDNDMTISITRGDVATIPVSAVGEAFKIGDIIRIKVFEKKNCANVIFQKDFGVAEETENFELVLTRNETKIGETINKPKTYWYEIELNPDTNPNTIVGYDEDGPKLFVLYPEGEDIEYIPPTEEEVGPIDYALSLTSKKPIANYVVAKNVAELDDKIKKSAENEAETRKKEIAREKTELETAIENEKAERKVEIAVERARINKIIALPEGSTTSDAELDDIRVDFTGSVHGTAGESVRNQFNELLKITGTGKNLFNSNNIDFADGFMLNEQGELSENSSYITSGYIEVKEGCTYIPSCKLNDSRVVYRRSCCLYDGEKNIVEIYSEAATTNSALITIPTGKNVKYIRISTYSESYGGADWQIEEGSTRTDYEPFHHTYRFTDKVTSDEIKDLRLDFAGGVHKTAGESVRNQLSELFEITGTGKNLFNHNDIDFADGYVIDTTGKLVKNSAFMTTGYIPIEKGKTYYVDYIKNNVRTGLTRAYCIYDEDYNVLQVFSSTQLVNLANGITNDSEFAKFVRVSIYSDTVDKTVSNVQMLEGGISDYEPFHHTYRLKNNVAVNIFTPAKWCAMGDSITEGYYSYIEDGTGLYAKNSSESWAYKVAKLNGYDLTNKAVGGSGYVSIRSEESPVNNARMVADSTDFSFYDLVTLAFGVNDWKYNCMLGSMSDDVETGGTIYSNMRYVIEKILADNPTCKIVVITPINCNKGNYQTNYGLGYSFSNNGTLETIYQAQKDVCEYYGIELIDMTHCSVVNRANIENVLLDGVHPSIECLNVMARELSKKINMY